MACDSDGEGGLRPAVNALPDAAAGEREPTEGRRWMWYWRRARLEQPQAKGGAATLFSVCPSLRAPTRGDEVGGRPDRSGSGTLALAEHRRGMMAQGQDMELACTRSSDEMELTAARCAVPSMPTSNGVRGRLLHEARARCADLEKSGTVLHGRCWQALGAVPCPDWP